MDTLITTYSDRFLIVPNTNPIILNVYGEANIFAPSNTAIKLVFTSPTGDLTSPIWTQDYVTEGNASNTAVGEAIGTVNNIYHVDTVPAYMLIPDGLSLVMIPDVANQDTLITRTFTGTGINDPVFSGPYVGSTSSIFSIQIDSVFVSAPAVAPVIAQALGAGVITAGNHSMKYTFVTALGESNPSPVSNVVNFSGTKNMEVTNVPIGGTEVTARKIYINQAGGTTWYLAATISDNVTTTTNISVADAALVTPAPNNAYAVDTFKWRKDAGAWVTNVSITGNLQTLQQGFAVTFSEVQGHTLGDLWTYSVRPPAYLDFCDLGASIIYKSVDGVLVALSGNDIIAGIPAHMDWSSSQSSWILLNPTQPVLTSQIPSRMRKEIISTYSVLIADEGKELSCNGTFTVTLPACSGAVNKFYYINNTGTGVITVATAGGTDLIVLPGVPTGVASFTLDFDSWLCVQLVTNGANWHMTTETVLLHGSVELTGTDWVCPMWVRKIWVTGQAAGGGGGGNTGAGGGAGDWTIKQELVVVPGTTYLNIVGTGGIGGTGGGDGAAGGNTQFGVSPAINMIVLNGGTGGAGGATLGAGENGLFGKGGAAGSAGAGAAGNGKGSGGGGGDAGADGGAGADGRLFLEW